MLRQLPKPPSNDAFAEILHLVSDFGRDMARHLEGTPEGHGLLQTLRPVQEWFKKAIRQTAPDFRPELAPKSEKSQSWSRGDDEVFDVPSCPDSEDEENKFRQPDFLRAEEPDIWDVVNDGKAIYVDEVMKRAQQ